MHKRRARRLRQSSHMMPSTRPAALSFRPLFSPISFGDVEEMSTFYVYFLLRPYIHYVFITLSLRSQACKSRIFAAVMAPTPRASPG
jgi:hypothetical protein